MDLLPEHSSPLGHLALHHQGKYWGSRILPLPFSFLQIEIMHQFVDCFLRFYGKGSQALQDKYWRAQFDAPASSKTFATLHAASPHAMALALNALRALPFANCNQKISSQHDALLQHLQTHPFVRKDGKILPEKPFPTTAQPLKKDYVDLLVGSSPALLLPEGSFNSLTEHASCIWNDHLIAMQWNKKHTSTQVLLHWDDFKPQLLEHFAHARCIATQLDAIQALASYLKLPTLSSKTISQLKAGAQQCSLLSESVEFLSLSEEQRALNSTQSYALWNHQKSGYLQAHEHVWGTSHRAAFFASLEQAEAYRKNYGYQFVCSIVQFELTPTHFIEPPKNAPFDVLCARFQSQLEQRSLEKSTPMPMTSRPPKKSL